MAVIMLLRVLLTGVCLSMPWAKVSFFNIFFINFYPLTQTRNGVHDTATAKEKIEHLMQYLQEIKALLEFRGPNGLV